jgi:hypothetical protein
MKKPRAALRVLNQEFEDDLKLGSLLRQYRQHGNELLSLGSEISAIGFTLPDMERKHMTLSVMNMNMDIEDGGVMEL